MTNILYVDDEADIREVAEFSLSLRADWSVRSVSSGLEAEALIKAGFRPDAILLDVMMPGLDGPQTLKRLRELPGYETTPIVFVTAAVLTSERARLMSLGAAGVIAKPFDPMKFAADVAALAFA